MTTELICVREPDNEHDHNAIKVMIDIDLVNTKDFIEPGQEPSDVFSIDEEGHYQLGYIPRDIAEILAPVLDKMGGSCVGVLGFTMEGRPQVSMEVDEEASA